MSKENELDFNLVVNDILKNDKFINLKYEFHHGLSRMDHSLHVARITYLTCKKMHLKNINEVTRAALLHDFYTSDEIEKHPFVNHPNYALKNASEQFDINYMQQNIIASHMFPACKTLPKCKESYLVSTIDKLVAMYELTKYKAPIEVGIILLFIINFISIQR